MLPFRLSGVQQIRQYRGGYQVAGLTDRARELRVSQTKAERVLWRLLRNRQLLGYKFRRQHQFGSYVADFYCHGAQLVIECDGSIHEERESWHHDQERDAYMVANGLPVLRFTNSQILKDIKSVLRIISEHLVSESTIRPSPQPSPKGRGRTGPNSK